MSSSLLYTIIALPGRGDGLIASRLIQKGEVIFTEQPAIYHSRSKSEALGFCSYCGMLISSRHCGMEYGIDEPSTAIQCKNAHGRNSNNSTGSSSSSSSSGCSGSNCLSSYCSINCRDLGDFEGHRWLCGDTYVDRYKVSTKTKQL